MSNALALIEQAAADMNHFGGGSPMDMGVENYNGEGDVVMDFTGSGPRNLALRDDLAVVKLEIINTHPTAPITFDIWGGYRIKKRKTETIIQGNAAAIAAGGAVPAGTPKVISVIDWAKGQMIDGRVYDKADVGYQAGANTGLVVNTLGSSSVEDILDFWEKNPTFVRSIGIDVDNPLQLQVDFQMFELNPYAQKGQKFLRPNTYSGPDTFRDNTAKIDLSGDNVIHFNSTTAVQYTILKNTTVQLTLYMGANLNSGKSLEKKVAMAERNFSRQNRNRR